jgi:hypothetical protein
MVPGTYLVDSYPLLRYVPGYTCQLEAWQREEIELYRAQLDTVRNQMVYLLRPCCAYEWYLIQLLQANNKYKPCFASYLVENQQNYRLSDDELAYLAGGMFGAGSETVCGFLLTTFAFNR